MAACFCLYEDALTAVSRDYINMRHHRLVKHRPKLRMLKPKLKARSAGQTSKQIYGHLLKNKQAIGLVGGGLLMGMAPVNAWWLAWIAMIPLWWAARRSLEGQPLRSAIAGATLWGLAYHGSALSWVTGTHPITWLGVTWLQSFLAIVVFAWLFVSIWATAIVITWITLITGLNRLAKRTATGSSLSIFSQILIGTALWCAIEWVWSLGPLYWSSLSYTQSPGNLWLLQLGQLSGPTVTTAAIVAVNGLLAEAWLHRADSRIGNRIGQSLFYSAIALFTSLHLIGLGLYLQPLADNPEAAIEVGLIQGNIPTNRKLTAAGIQEARDVYLEGYESLVEAGAEIVVTPEGAIPQRWNAFLQSQDLLQRAVIRNGIPLVLGTFVHEDINDRTTPLTQSLLTLTADGKVFGRYKKSKLAPLGEYLPLESFLAPIIGGSPFGSSMVPGTFNQRLETPVGPFAASICYESAFPEIFRQHVREGGEIILTASNNDPYPSKQMEQHHAQDVMRAIETDRWAVRVTNTGISGIVDPKGRSQWLSTTNTRVIHLAQLYPRQTQTLYVQWGDWLMPLLLGISAVVFGRLYFPKSTLASNSPNSKAEN